MNISGPRIISEVLDEHTGPEKTWHSLLRFKEDQNAFLERDTSVRYFRRSQ